MFRFENPQYLYLLLFLVVLAVIFCLGGASIRSFAFAMILGVIFGTCSSVFVAAPTAYLTMGKTIKEESAKN